MKERKEKKERRRENARLRNNRKKERSLKKYLEFKDNKIKRKYKHFFILLFPIVSLLFVFSHANMRGIK